MTSTHIGVQGGAFGKQSRFHSKEISTPGPIYAVPSLFTEHVQSYIYKPVEKRDADILCKSMPNPAKDRTAWLIGTTKNDLAYYSNVAAQMGPALYDQDTAPIKRRNERTVFGKDSRFRSITKQYISKDHNMANLCTASPGPKYYSEIVTNNTLVTDQQPAYTFRSKGDSVADRASFLKSEVMNGYIYQARPSTAHRGVNVGPANYAPDFKVNQNRAPRAIWGKADRFRPCKKIFISKKHSQDLQGTASPGPQYRPVNGDMGLLRRTAVFKEGVFLSA